MCRENADISVGGGIKTDFDLEIGYLAMVGAKVETDVHFGVSIYIHASFFLQD